MVLFPVEGTFCLSCTEKHWSICAVRKPGYVSAGAFPVTGHVDGEIPECWIVSTSSLKWEETRSQQMCIIHCHRRSLADGKRTPGFWAGLDLSVLLWTSASPVPGRPLVLSSRKRSRSLWPHMFLLWRNEREEISGRKGSKTQKPVSKEAEWAWAPASYNMFPLA